MDDSSNLLEHLKILATSEGRAIGTPGHERARKYLCANLNHLGLSPYADSFEMEDQTNELKLINIVATAPGLDHQAPPILLGAHYDTFESYPGADDNAAGVAILLEIARSLKQSPAACDVILAFFDGEELGGIDKDMMGSTKFYHKQSTRPIRCGFILDLVGHDVPIANLENIMFVTGMESSSSWSKHLHDAETDSGIKWATVLDSYVNSPSDHYIYVQNKLPYLFFSCGRWAHYHSPSDTFEKLNYTKMAHFKNALLDLVYQCANNAPTHGTYDSTNDELMFLKKNLLPGLGMVDAPFNSRQDIDKLARFLLSNFEV